MPQTPFDNLTKASFAGFVFPVSEVTLTGGLRDHVHEYPHSPGGAPEKLGRKLYEIRMRCPFQQGLRGYPDLFPATLQSLRIIYEGGRSFDLEIPTVGTITAYCTAWVETATPQKNRMGVEVELTFREDQSEQFLVDKLVTATVGNYRGAVFAYNQALADQRARAAEAQAALDQPDFLMLEEIPLEELVLFDQVSTIGAELLDAIGTGLGFGIAIAEIALGLVSLCAEIEATSTALQDVTRFPLLDALQDVWLMAQQVAQQATRVNVRRVDYPVPQVMSISDVSRAIYGSNDHAIDLMAGNAIPNPFAIPAGFVIKAYVFDATTTVASAA